jgi:hypothetical protein
MDLAPAELTTRKQHAYSGPRAGQLPGGITIVP